MNIIKRSGKEVAFDETKITDAVRKANASVTNVFRLTDEQILDVTRNVTKYCEGLNRAATVEEIQDCVEEEIMRQSAYKVAINYVTYRYQYFLF